MYIFLLKYGSEAISFGGAAVCVKQEMLKLLEILRTKYKYLGTPQHIFSIELYCLPLLLYGVVSRSWLGYERRVVKSMTVAGG